LPEAVHDRIDLAQALPHLADLLKRLGRWQEAIDIRRRVIHVYETLKANYAEDLEHRRKLVLSYLELACLLYGLGRQAEATEPYRKALELEDDDPAVNNELAWFLATSPESGLRDSSRALRLARKVVTARPESANYRNTLGVAYYRSGDDTAAVTELERAMSMQGGGTPFDWFFLAMANSRLGDREKARTLFDRAVEWMAGRKPHDNQLCRIRAEAQAILADPGLR
jgi:tetratricopeptide (TPR) repeat protein